MALLGPAYVSTCLESVTWLDSGFFITWALANPISDPSRQNREVTELGVGAVGVVARSTTCGSACLLYFKAQPRMHSHGRGNARGVDGKKDYDIAPVLL